MDNPDKCDLISPFELHGFWWREGEDDIKRVAGSLSFSPEHGLQLQLSDDLPSNDPMAPWGEHSRRPIWGQASGFAGKKVHVSLLDPIPTNQPNDPNAADKPSSHTIYFVNRAILGSHVVDPSSLKLTSIHFSLSDLELFNDTAPLFVLPTADGVRLDYVRQNRDVGTLAEYRMAMKIATLVESESSLFGRNCSISYRDEIVLTPTTATSFDDCMEVMFTLRNFFVVCSRESVQIRYLRAGVEDGSTISVFGLLNPRKKRMRHGDWILTARDMQDNFLATLNRWLTLAKGLRFIAPVFFSELLSPSRVQDARFFHFAGCLEAFHRDVLHEQTGKFLPRVEYKNVVNILLDQLPADIPLALEEAMRSSLSHANDHSFGERISALFSSLEEPTRLNLTTEADRFLTVIKNSRNKLAHISDNTSKEVFKGREIAHANLSIRAWLTILLLRECGVAESLILEKMKAMNYFYWGPFAFVQPTHASG